MARILVLVPHDPDADPRIGWVTGLCAAVGETVVLGTTWSREEETRDRTYIPGAVGKPAQVLGTVGGKLQRVSALLPWRPVQFSASWLRYSMIVDALYRRAGEEPRPDLILCHDLMGLMAGVRLKRRWHVPLLYDTHEYWPQGNLQHKPWEESLLTRVERRLIREADQVVTVSPQLAAQLERVYGIEGVLSVPNAVPTHGEGLPARTPGGAVRFLVQGQLAAGRGFELLFDAWARIDADAVLQLRYVPNDYAAGLERRYAGLFESRRVEKLDPVGEEQLVEAAADADVGVVPYVGPNLNHLYASPNKVSEYMQAGLALLASSDLEYVGSLLRRFECGLTYDPRRPETLRAAVESLVGDPQGLSRMKAAAAGAAATEFNWEAVSKPYGDAIRRLLEAA